MTGTHGMMHKTFYQFLIFLSMSFVCLYLAFSATANIPYVNHDSIRYFHKFYNKENLSQSHPMEDYLYAEGRPLTAGIEQLLYHKINSLSDMSMLRVITIAVFTFNASLLTMIAMSAGMEMIPAFCVSTVIFTLPGVQEFIFVPYLPHALAIFLSLLACCVLLKELKYGMQFIAALLFLEAAFFIYPPSTFFFLIPTVLMIIFQHDWQVAKRVWLRDICIWILAAVINYFILRMFFYTQIKSSGHSIAFTWKDTLFFTMTFLPNALPQIFNLWDIYYSKTLGICLISFIVVCLAADFFVTRKIGKGRLSALIVVFLILNLVWFFFGGYMPQQFIASQAFALILVYWCGEWLINIWKNKHEVSARIWPIIFLCIGLIVTNQMVTSNVLNNHAELMFIRSRLAQSVNSTTKEIHVIRLKDTARGYNGLPTVYDNFNASVPDYEIPDLMRVALREFADPFELHCIVTFSNDGEPFSLLPNAVVINMNDLVYSSRSL
jgi:hypothetical protein